MNKMKYISTDKINCSEMFSKKGWKEVKERCGHITPQSDDVLLADGFSFFVEIWLEDNGYCIDIWNPDKTKTGESFFCEYNECRVFFKGNLEDTLLNRYTEYLLGD